MIARLNTPWMWVLGAALLLLLASLLWRGPKGPALAPGETYYTGPMVSKSKGFRTDLAPSRSTQSRT